MQVGSASSIALSDLLGLTRFHAGTRDNIAAYSDADIIAMMNIKQRALQAQLLAALNYDYKESTIDGTGTGLINLVANDHTYVFPTDMIQLDRVEITYTGEVNSYVPVTIVPLQGISHAVSNNESNATITGSKARPVIYIRNGTFYLDPVPDVAVEGGMKIWGQTLVTDLEVGVSTPVFSPPFHQLLAIDSAEEWCGAHDKMQKANRLFQKRAIVFQEMVDFYSTRIAVEQPVMRPKHRSMR